MQEVPGQTDGPAGGSESHTHDTPAGSYGQPRLTLPSFPGEEVNVGTSHCELMAELKKAQLVSEAVAIKLIREGGRSKGGLTEEREEGLMTISSGCSNFPLPPGSATPPVSNWSLNSLLSGCMLPLPFR